MEQKENLFLYEVLEWKLDNIATFSSDKIETLACMSLFLEGSFFQIALLFFAVLSEGIRNISVVEESFCGEENWWGNQLDQYNVSMLEDKHSQWKLLKIQPT